MKRTNLVLDEDLLEEAKRVTGAKTYSATVDRALRELIRKANIRQILDLQGTGLWEGDLGAMRGEPLHRTADRGSHSSSPQFVADRPWPDAPEPDTPPKGGTERGSR